MPDNVIKFEKEIVANCPCGSELWYIHVDKPNFTKLLKIECSECGKNFPIEFIEDTKVDDS